MAEWSALWETDPAGVGDQEVGYTESHWSDIGRILAACAGFEGVAPGYGNELAATLPAANTVRIATGGGIVDGKVHDNTTPVDINVPTPGAGTERIDLIVLRCTWASYTVRITRIAGVAAAVPAAPAITQNSGIEYDIRLWQAHITAAGTITLTDEREFSGARADGVTLQNVAGVLSIAPGGVDTAQLAPGAVTEVEHDAGVAYGEYHPALRQGNDALQVDAGGNARGNYAVDLQQVRVAAAEAATGAYAAIPGGRRNIASGADSFAAGAQATASGSGAMALGNSVVASGSPSFATGQSTVASQQYAVALGNTTTASGIASIALGVNTVASGYVSFASGIRAVASMWGQFARSSGRFLADGDAQMSYFVARRAITTHADTTWYTLPIDGVNDTALVVPASSAWTVGILVVGMTQHAAEAFSYQITGIVTHDNAGNIAIAAQNVTTIYEDDAAYDARLAVDGGTGALLLQVRRNGGGDLSIRWVAALRAAQVTFAA